MPLEKFKKINNPGNEKTNKNSYSVWLGKDIKRKARNNRTFFFLFLNQDQALFGNCIL